MARVPEESKALCRELIDLFDAQSNTGAVQSRSQTAGALSESESYITSPQLDKQVSGLIYDYLSAVTDDNGTPLLYRGCMI